MKGSVVMIVVVSGGERDDNRELQYKYVKTSVARYWNLDGAYKGQPAKDNNIHSLVN